MTERRHAALMALAFLVVFVAVNIAVGAVGAGWREDVSVDRRHSVSAPVRAMLQEIDEPIALDFYFGAEAAGAHPDLLARAAKVRQMLRAFSAATDGRIRVREIDPRRLSEAEDEALRLGVPRVRPNPGEDPIWFGFVGRNAVADRLVRPAPPSDAHIEAHLAAMMRDLERGRAPRIALLSAAPEDRADALQPRLLRALEPLGQVSVLRPGFEAVPEGVDLLVAAHPWALSTVEAAALQRRLDAGGATIVAVDPRAAFAEAAPGAADPLAVYRNSAPAQSDLPDLLASVGLSLQTPAPSAEPTDVALAPAALAIAPGPGAAAQGLADGFAVAPGFLAWAPRPDGAVTPLLETALGPLAVDARSGSRALTALADVDALARDPELLARLAQRLLQSREARAFPARAERREGDSLLDRLRRDLPGARPRDDIAHDLAEVQSALDAPDGPTDAASREALTQRALELRAELRAIDGEYRRRLETLEAWSLAANLAAAPGLVGLAAAASLWMRRKRRHGGTA